MTPEKTKESFQECLKLVLKKIPRAESKRVDPNATFLYAGELADHLYFMCEEGQNLVEQGRIDKAQRWLGFIQGALWAYFKCTIEEMKSMNRSEETKEESKEE